MRRLALKLLLVCGLPVMAYTPGQDVGEIRFADQIDQWTVIDERHVILSIKDHAKYLVTFRAPCQGLRFARNVGVSSSNNTVYAGFDRVIADGLPCPIATIV